MIIYKITNDIDNNVYVGQTTKTLMQRWKKHIIDAKNGREYPLHFAIRKYGTEHFHVEQIDTACSMTELDEKEKYWIKKLNTQFPDGYNLTEGGHNFKWTESMYEKHSGENHWTRRKGFSKEALQKKHDALYRKPSGRSKPVRCVETGEVFSFAKEFEYRYGYCSSKILACCKGHRNTHHGLHWEYADEVRYG